MDPNKMVIDSTVEEVINDIMFESWTNGERIRRQENEPPFDQEDYTRF